MPHFDDHHVAFIKKTLLPRVPECLFTQEDIDHIVCETSLDDDQIQQWAKHFRASFPAQDREKALQTLKIDQVFCIQFFCIQFFFMLISCMKQVEKTQIENLDADLMTIETHMQTITNQKQTISNQAKIIEAIEQIIASKDRDNQLLAEKNYTQSCILARLNQEKTEDVKRINDLTGKLEMKDKTILRLVGTQSSDTGIAEKITNIHNFIQEFARGFNEEFSRKRKADD